MPYLDQAGLSAFWGKVKNWVAAKSASTMAKGTASADGIPLTMSNGAETPVVLSTVKITKDDIAATGAKVTDTVYTHPASAAGAKASGLYKIATDAQGHVTAATAVEKSDITGLGIPGSVPSYDSSTLPLNPLLAGYMSGATVHDVLKDLKDGKQDKIGDLEAIRDGAKAGATAVQKETDPTVPAWAKASTKPSYKAHEVALNESADLDIFAGAGNVDNALIELADAADANAAAIAKKQDAISDLATIREGAAKGATALQSFTETDPTVPAWAKASTKPSYKASEIAVPQVPGMEMNVELTLQNHWSRIRDKADADSPTLTGTPKAPTAAAGTSTTQIATTAFVSTAVANAMTGAAKYKGAMTPASYAALKSYTQGWYWVVTTAGTVAGEACEAGDMVFCNATKSGLSAPAAADFDIVQNNITAIPDSVINGLS